MFFPFNSTEDKSCVPYSKLAARAAAASELLWVLRPKFHETCLNLCTVLESERGVSRSDKTDPSKGWQEIAYAAYLDGHNPRYSHTFRDESFMGTVKAVAKKCHRHTLEKSFLKRYYVEN